MANHVVPSPPRQNEVSEWTLDELMERLQDVHWERLPDYWDGIAGKFTPKGTFTIGAPKEVGHAVADSLEKPDSPGGKKIRGLP